MAKKGTKGIIAGIIGVSAIIGIFSPNKNVESISLSVPNRQPQYDINTEIPIEVSVLPEGAGTSSLEYIFEEGTTFTESKIITGDTEGTYEFYITSGDIKSNVLRITVVDMTAREEAKAAKEAEAQRQAEEKAAKEAEAQRQAEEQAAKEAEAQRLAEEQAAKEAEAEAQRLAEEQASKEAEAQRQAEEKAAKEAEAQRQAEEKAAKEAEAQRQAQEQTTGQAEPNTQTSEQTQEPSGTQNNNTGTSGGSSNFNTYDNASQQQTEATYVLNTNTMKIHHPTCSSVKKIAPQNYATSNSSLEELINQGYSTCGNCFK